MDTPTLRWRRLDLLKVFCLLILPLFLLVSYWTPFHGRYPTREELRATLRELDDAAYLQSGCDTVTKVLARCEKFRAECPSQYYFELRTLNRNCHALSTQKLEDCLVATPGGKCVFEMEASWCGEGISEILACHKAAMQSLLAKVLTPPFDSPAPASAAEHTPPPAAAAKEAAAAAAAAAAAEHSLRGGEDSGAAPAPSPSPTPLALLPEGAALAPPSPAEDWLAALRQAAGASRAAAEEEALELGLIYWALPAPQMEEEGEEERGEGSAQLDLAAALDALASAPAAAAKAAVA